MTALRRLLRKELQKGEEVPTTDAAETQPRPVRPLSRLAPASRPAAEQPPPDVLEQPEVEPTEEVQPEPAETQPPAQVPVDSEEGQATPIQPTEISTPGSPTTTQPAPQAPVEPAQQTPTAQPSELAQPVPTAEDVGAEDLTQQVIAVVNSPEVDYNSARRLSTTLLGQDQIQLRNLIDQLPEPSPEVLEQVDRLVNEVLL